MKACPNCRTSYPVHYTHCPRDGSTLVEGTAWQEGAVIRGKYRILSKLGEGGMAVVYKAVHMRFEEMRALKVMSAELSGDHAFVKRFLQEAVLTRKIHHPNAVRVEDIDEAEDGRPFMVMEYLEGRGLKEAIQAEAPMAPTRVSAIGRQIAGALDTAHRLGIVHRDVKPANIVLIGQQSNNGVLSGGPHVGEQAKVLDFGIAKAREARLEETLMTGETLTRTGSVIGTPTYMSPEQARGLRGADLDGRSDIYSLGIVMYQMLVGGLPFKADTSMEWLIAHLQVAPTPLGEFRNDLQVPPPLADAVMRCLAKDPASRPASAEVLIRELEEAEAEMPGGGAPTVFFPTSQRSSLLALREPSRARVVRQAEVVEPERSRSKGWIGWTAAAVVVLAIGFGIVFWKGERMPWESTKSRSGVSARGGTAVANPSSAAAPPAPAPPPVLYSPGNASVAQTGSATQPSSGGGPNPAGAAELPRVDPSGAAAASAARPVPIKKLQAMKPPGLALAIQHAKDAEEQGRFEDALQGYELASELDPTDPSLKRHIALLRARISKENDLIR